MSKRKRMKTEKEDVPYVPSDSGDETSDTEKILLEKVRREVNSDSDENEEEVYGLPSSGSTDGEDEKMSVSDIEGQGDDSDDLPDVRAWGQKRRNFYNTDYVDQDHGGFNEKDVEAAEHEEEEAKVIQKRLAEQLDEGDFLLDMFRKGSLQKDRNVEDEEVIRTDLSKMSKKQKLALFQKESPEFFGLVEDFKVHMMEIEQKIEPILTLIKSGKIPPSSADGYVQTKYHLVLNYCVNIAFYLLLKSQRIAVQSHPVIRRLYQYRQLLKQLKPVDKVMTSQIESILAVVHDGGEIIPLTRENTNREGKTKAPKKKALKFLSNLREEAKNNDDEVTELPARLTALSEDGIVADSGGAGLNSMDSPVGVSELDKDKDEEEERKEAEKRGITYQIAKNKGLTPHRKKEQRNPRVKHRNKFRKAIIRRKGQVRVPRKEVEKYGGEVSGIKIGVVKSIKLK